LEDTVTIEAAHYQETRDALAKDPIIQAMATELSNLDLVAEATHESGNPRYEFMLGALREYKRRGGTIQTHIGGPAEAILAIVKAGSPTE
jgi:hypothetical protein